MLTRESRRPCSCFPQIAFEITRRETKQRHDTEHNRNQYRQTESECDSSAVDSDLRSPWQVSLIETQDKFYSPIRKQHAESAGGNCQQQILSDELPAKSPTRGAERGAHRELPLSRRYLGQQ